MADSEVIFCSKCKKTKGAINFYQSHNLEKYPTGKLNMCKECLTMHVDNWDPETYLWILQECDVPYIPEEWNKILMNYGQDKSKVTGMTIIGRYLSKMKLKQYKDFRWKDTEYLQEVANAKIKEAMKRQGYGAAEIAQEIDQKTIVIPEGGYKQPVYKEDDPYYSSPEETEEEDYFARQSGEDTSTSLDLTDEDRVYLRLKWGKAYKPEEWVRLEQLYNEMIESYDIQSAGHIDTLKLVCKTSLKCNQLIDIGDIDGYQKMSKVYDNLMKSGKFQAVQNKQENGEFVDSIGELIDMCEKQGYIERFYVEQPNDKVDFTIKDMQRYTRTLIEEETNLSQMVEQALKANAKEDEDAKENEETDIIDDLDPSLDDLEKSLQDQDFVDFNDFIEQEQNQDLEENS